MKRDTYLIIYVHAFESYMFKRIHQFCFVSAWAHICGRVIESIGRAKLDHKLRVGNKHKKSHEKLEINEYTAVCSSA